MEMQATCLHVGVERQQEQERRDSRKNDGTSKEELKLKEELARAGEQPFVGNQPATTVLEAAQVTAIAYIIITNCFCVQT